MKKLLCVVPLVLVFCFSVACQDRAAMAELEKFKAQVKVEEQNKGLYRKAIEEWNSRNSSYFKDAYGPGYTFFLPSGTSKSMSREEVIEMMKMVWTAFPDSVWNINEIVAGGDMVMSKNTLKGTHLGLFQNIPATGNKVEFSVMNICHIRDGKIVEEREDVDMLSLYQQLGMELKPVEATAQEKEGQRIAFPQLSQEQKLDRAVRNVNSRDLGGIAYAKSLGKTAADFGKFQGQLTAYLWADIKGKGPIPFVQYWSRFVQTDVNSKMEVLKATNKSVEARMTVYGEKNLKSLASLGVTAEEYATYYGAMSEALADSLGLDYRQKHENGWIVFTVSEKK